MNKYLLLVLTGLLLTGAVLGFAFGGFGSFDSAVEVSFTGGVPFSEIGDGKGFLLDETVEEGEVDRIWAHLRDIQPAWLITGADAAAEKMIRDTLLDGLPENVSEGAKLRFSPSIGVTGSISARAVGFFATGAEKVVFSGTISATYGNNESVRQFVLAANISVSGVLPGELYRERRAKALASAFAKMAEAMLTSGNPQGEVITDEESGS
ncbi:MAG: hypothetical protein Kow00107_04560 [Planctomycetota bacterium]